jgi:hypothetical protein
MSGLYEPRHVEISIERHARRRPRPLPRRHPPPTADSEGIAAIVHTSPNHNDVGRRHDDLPGRPAMPTPSHPY